MATDSIRMICPNLRCRSVLSVPSDARGKTVRCRQCGTRVRVPALGGGRPGPKPATPETANAENDEA